MTHYLYLEMFINFYYKFVTPRVHKKKIYIYLYIKTNKPERVTTYQMLISKQLWCDERNFVHLFTIKVSNLIYTKADSPKQGWIMTHDYFLSHPVYSINHLTIWSYTVRVTDMHHAKGAVSQSQLILLPVHYEAQMLLTRQHWMHIWLVVSISITSSSPSPNPSLELASSSANS